ncbi:restriction endonuclease subunit S [Mycoplasmopsis cynos]|nr:restriction endonuclease subunit S [Mycoplasmopsis felis]WQQ11879.1 restriction endonuclease subunit S [Mycoplasmopsis felis]
MKKVLVPSVRFKRFSEEWKEEKIESFSKITIGEFVIKTKQNDFYEYPVYNGGITNTGFYKEYNNEGNKIIVSARGANAGHINFIEKKYWAGNSCYSIDLISNRQRDIKFIFYSMLINKNKFDDNKQVGTIPSVSLEDVRNFIIYFASYSEQQKIGKLLDQISNLITLEQSKLNKLKQLKETLLQKMFPEGNSKTPRIRFKGFEGEWKEYKFNDIGSYYSTSSLSYNDLSKGGQYKCVLYGELYTKYNERIFNVISRTNKKITLTQPNDILFPTSTTVDPYSLISPSCVNEENVMTGGDLFGIRPYKNINGNFISYYINNVEYIKNKLANKAQGLTIIHLYYKNILNENLYIASLEEQNKIAKLFVKIDTIINLYQSKLNKLEQIKKALLQKMFV